MTLDVLHSDNHVLAVAKPAGLPTVPDESGDPALLDLAREWVRERFAKPGDVFLGVVHRLDRPVSGVVVLARTSKAAARLGASFRARSAVKTYVGLAARDPRSAEGRVVQWLAKDRTRNRVSVVEEGAPGAREAVTDWRVLAPRAGTSPCVLELLPRTGRPHQLRLACKAIAGPLLGDLRYGANEALADASIALHARRLEVAHPTAGTVLALTAPFPALAAWDAARASLGGA